MLEEIFKIPNAVTIMGRSSSITNSFVNGIIPVIKPSAEEIQKALSILWQDPENVSCAYCGDKMTEWDHLNPLIIDKEPTWYITEIANLIPACGKCNQSKGNSHWKKWIVSNAKLSPMTRNIEDLDLRIQRIEEYVKHFRPTQIDLEDLIDPELWRQYWKEYQNVIQSMKTAQKIMDKIKEDLKDKSKNEIVVSSTGLNRDLQTVGKSTFIKYFKEFMDSKYSRQELIQIISDNENYSVNSINSKVSVGLKIVRENNYLNALQNIAESKMIDEEIIEQAKVLLSEFGGL